MSAKLIQLGGGQQTYSLHKRETVIGRESDNDIIVDDERVSKRHARVVRKQDEYYLEDLESRNGTFFEGKSIARLHLQSNDEFKIGPIGFRFVIEYESEMQEHSKERPPRKREMVREQSEYRISSPAYFYYPVIRALNDGEIISRVVAVSFQIAGIAAFFGITYTVIEILKESFKRPTEVTISGIILAIFLFVASLAVLQIFFYRAKNIKDLGHSRYTVIPIFSFFFRAIGESFATMGVATGIGGCLYMWFSTEFPFGGGGILFQFMYPERVFLSGLLFLLWMVLISFVVLIIAYLFAESTIVTVDIADNVRHLSERSEGFIENK